MKSIRTAFLLLVVFCTSGVFAQKTYFDIDTICLNITKGYGYGYRINNVPPQWWAWSMPGANPDTAFSTTDSLSPYFSFPQAGVYELTVTMRLANNVDTSFYALVIALDPAPPANTLGDDTVYCGAFTRTLDAGNPGSLYVWSTGETTRTIQVNAPGTYEVDIANKCYSGTFDIVLGQNSTPFVDLGPDGFVCDEAPKELYAGSSNHSYLWNTGETTPTITTGNAGTYTVVVTNADGCESSDEIMLRDSCPPDLFMPTAFTPNRDGRNDTLMPVVKGIDSLYFAVYNRWGELMFETTEINVGWNGWFGGSPAQNDIYIWKITALDANGNKHNRRGIFVLYR